MLPLRLSFLHKCRILLEKTPMPSLIGRNHCLARSAGSILVLLATPAAGPLRGQVVEPGKVKPSEIGAIASMKHDIQPFGKTNDGQEVKVHTLTNLNGIRVRLIDYGATLIGVETPDRTGKNTNITLGFKTLDGYLQRH